MRKITSIILILSILIISTSTYANSGPTYWRGKQSSEILTIEDNTSIRVKKEDLIFDFTEEKYENYSLSARVTAKYTMSNDGKNRENIQMAFPLISTIGGFDPGSIDIKKNNEKVDFQIFLGDPLYSITDRDSEDMKFDFNSIVKSISSSEYIPKHYDIEEIGTLYTYHLESNSEDDLNIAIENSYDKDKSTIMTKGFNGYQNIDGVESFISTNINNEELQIFVLGEDVDLNFKAYSDSAFENETEEYSLDIETKEISFRDYLEESVEIFKEEIDYLDHLADNQIFNLLAKQLDESIGKDVVNLHMDSYLSMDSLDMFFVLIYEVEFDAFSTKDISVSYSSTGTMSIVETVEPIYTFAYILNPAKNWTSFNDLNIEIKPPSSSPYIIDSSLELDRKEDGTYTGKFETLPDEDLFFSLYYKEEITTMDKIKSFLIWRSSIVIPLLLWAMIALIIFIAKRIYKRVKK